MKTISLFLKKIAPPIFFILCALILFFSLRGLKGNPNEFDLLTENWQQNGPLELSPDRGRFALTYSIAEDHSLHFSLPLAKFATPDLGYFNGKYVSLFDPGVSFLVIPGYLIGKYFQASQLGTFAVISIFAIVNALFIVKICQFLGISKVISYIASLVFLFATPAFSYGVTLYQHHITTFLLLYSIYLLLKYDTFFSILLLWFLIALSVSIDYPNLILMLPIIAATIGKSVLIKKRQNKILVKTKPIYILSIIGIIFPLFFFLWFNKTSYGNPLQIASTVPTITSFDNQDNKQIKDVINPDTGTSLNNQNIPKKSAANFFKTRNLLNGLYILLFSPDRGITNYTPVILLGLFGIYVGYKKKIRLISVLLSIIGLNILLYAMWGDPWGGWAFGSRYLIPTYALMSVFLAIGLAYFQKYLLFTILFALLFSYSTLINTVGALTSNALPPKIEVLELEKVSNTVQKFTYQKNFDLLNENKSKAYIFQEIAKNYINSWQYFWIVFSIISSLFLVLIIIYQFSFIENFVTKARYFYDKKIFINNNFNFIRKLYGQVHKRFQ
jgi:hypothetical protein